MCGVLCGVCVECVCVWRVWVYASAVWCGGVVYVCRVYMCAECVCVFKRRDRKAEQVFLEYQREESVPKRRLSGSKCFKHMLLVFK